jgi:hypothetical protein
LGSGVITVIERTVSVVVGVDVVSDTSRVPVDVNRRMAVGGVQMRRGQQAGNRKQRDGQNRSPPIV